MKIELNIEKKYAYFILGLLITLIGILLVNALNPGDKPNPGHSTLELGIPSQCTSGQVLSYDGANWVCRTVSGNTPDYDSGWFSVTTKTEYTKTHDLGTKDYTVLILYRENSGASYYNIPSHYQQPYRETWGAAGTGAVVLEQADNYVKIRTSGSPLATPLQYVNGIGVTDLNSKYYKTSGEYRVLLWKF